MGMTWYEILAERQKGRIKSDMDVVQEMDAMMMAYAAYAQALIGTAHGCARHLHQNRLFQDYPKGLL